MAGEVIYPGRDLESMAFAYKYHQWILELFKPYLGQRLVEVGAGSGSFSELLVELPTESLTLVEPSREMYPALKKHVENWPEKKNISTYNSIFMAIAPEIKTVRQPDSIIYVNVLEHISDDEAELRIIHETLSPGGRAFVFVPALSWLFGEFDRSIGHYRRYSKPELEQKCRRAGFRIVMSKYFDLIGVLPWWVKYRLLKSNRLEPRVVQLYDKFVPLVSVTERFVTPPLGKNLILVAEKA